MEIDVGALPAKLFLRFLDRYGDRIAFIRLGDWGERLCCYVSRAVAEAESLAIFEDCLTLANDPVPKMAAEQVRADFELTQRDYVLPWRFDLPLDFRL
jgi:hypothetical protein